MYASVASTKSYRLPFKSYGEVDPPRLLQQSPNRLPVKSYEGADLHRLLQQSLIECHAEDTECGYASAPSTKSNRRTFNNYVGVDLARLLQQSTIVRPSKATEAGLQNTESRELGLEFK